MRLFSRCLLPFVSLCLISGALADFLGPSYPAPVDVSGNSSLAAAGWRNVTSMLQSYLASSDAATAAMKNVTFSLGMFSLHDPAATSLQFHYTSPEIANSLNGTHEVNADSIYRIASVTKLFTVLAGLRELDAAGWERPLTEIFPGIDKYASHHSGDDGPIYTTHWDKITPSALAAQIAGVPRDGFPSLNEVAIWPLFYPNRSLDAASLGFPALNLSDPLSDPPCLETFIANGSCPPPEFIRGVANRPPSFLPWTNPGYANDGFSLLGLAIGAVTGKSFEQFYGESIFSPLGMASSWAVTPPVSEWHRAVIPGDPAANFAFDSGVFTSSGGLLSTTSDLAKFGVGILNSTLLPPQETRRWMKPVSHTARLGYSVGRPWEIVRHTLPGTGGKITDLYTKLGDSGAYSAYMILLPDYGAGFTIMAASTIQGRFEVVTQLADVIAQSMIPALEAQAAKEAEDNFAGVYTSTIPGASSSLTLTMNRTEGAAPGLVISSWTSNGKDELSKLTLMLGRSPPFRLVPSIVDAESKQVAFRLITAGDAPSAQALASGIFAGPAIQVGDWFYVDSPTYGGIGVTLFVFDVGRDGKATAISPAAYRVKLKKAT